MSAEFDEVRLRGRFRRIKAEFGWDSDGQFLGRRDNASPDEDRVAGKIDDGRNLGGQPGVRRAFGWLIRRNRRGRSLLVRSPRGQAPDDQTGAQAEDDRRGRQHDVAAAPGHGDSSTRIPDLLTGSPKNTTVICLLRRPSTFRPTSKRLSRPSAGPTRDRVTHGRGTGFGASLCSRKIPPQGRGRHSIRWVSTRRFSAL